MKKENITLILEDNEIIAWEANGKGVMLKMTISEKLADRIWKIRAIFKGKESALKVSKKKRTEYAKLGAIARNKKR